MNTTGSLVIGVVVLVAIATVGMGAGAAIGPGMMGPGMMGGYYGTAQGDSAGWSGGWGFAMGLGMLAMFAFWAAIIVGVVLLVRTLVGMPPAGTKPETEQPGEILRRRYAAGEIDEATYQHMKQQLAA